MQAAFRALGHEVSLFSPGANSEGREPGLKFQRWSHATFKRFLPQTITDWLRDLYFIYSDSWCYKAIRARIVSEAPDLIFERYGEYHASGARAAAEAGIPYVVQIHEPPEEKRYRHQDFNFRRCYRHVETEVTCTARVVVVVSTYLREYLVNQGISPEKILVLPNAVDAKMFRPMGNRDALRQRLGLEGKIVVGFVGSMSSWHGHELLPDVCAAVKERVPNIRFMVVGPFATNEERDEYLGLLQARGLHEYFVLTGGVPVERVPAYIEAMDVGVMPGSNAYGSPMKLFEYGALAKPVVMPRYAPIEEVLKDGVNGLLFEPRSVEDMAEKIVLLAKDEAERLRLGKQLHCDVLAKHTWTKNAERILQKVFESSA
ncbi:MAG TPA: glycosyltransferase family 4 protein [Phycisphaerae bacterium]|nr:glycosyltransferase family 4 protein [Phycisphaerae bacterium]